jgi:hypothetical protein
VSYALAPCAVARGIAHGSNPRVYPRKPLVSYRINQQMGATWSATLPLDIQLK